MNEPVANPTAQRAKLDRMTTSPRILGRALISTGQLWKFFHVRGASTGLALYLQQIIRRAHSQRP